MSSSHPPGKILRKKSTHTKNKASTKAQLTSTKAQITSTKAQLTSAKAQFTITKPQLTSTKAQLTSTKAQLTSAKAQLTSAKAQLTSAKPQLTSTKPQLTSTKAQSKAELNSSTSNGEIPFDVKKHFPDDLKVKLAKKDKIVELQKYSTKRQELLKRNKPVASYKPTILQTWTCDDWLRHTQRFLDREEAIKGASKVFKDKRSVVFVMTTDFLRSFMKPKQRTDRWWIVADTKAMLDDMNFLRDLVIADSTCRMRMPYEVLHDLTAMTAKHNKVWCRKPARKLVNFIEQYEGLDKIVIGQGPAEAEDLLDHPYATDAVLNCCMQCLRLYFHVVLISDDPVRKRKAKEIGIQCFTLKEVREHVTPSYKNYKDGKRCKISITVTQVPTPVYYNMPMQYYMPPPYHIPPPYNAPVNAPTQTYMCYR